MGLRCCGALHGAPSKQLEEGQGYDVASVFDDVVARGLWLRQG